MGKKKKLKKKVGKRLAEGESAFAVCLAGDCAPRDEAKLVLEHARAYVTNLEASGRNPRVRVVPFGCLGICKKGPIAATLPHVEIKKHVDDEKARAMIDALIAEAAPAPASSPVPAITRPA